MDGLKQLGDSHSESRDDEEEEAKGEEKDASATFSPTADVHGDASRALCCTSSEVKTDEEAGSATITLHAVVRATDDASGKRRMRAADYLALGAQAIRVKANELAETRTTRLCETRRRIRRRRTRASRSCCSAGESRGWRRWARCRESTGIRAIAFAWSARTARAPRWTRCSSPPSRATATGGTASMEYVAYKLSPCSGWIWSRRRRIAPAASSLTTRRSTRARSCTGCTTRTNWRRRATIKPR